MSRAKKSKVKTDEPKRWWQKLLSPFTWLRDKYRAHASKLPKSLRFIEGLVIALLMALLLRWLAINASWVPSGSMRPTLLEGDFLLVNRLVYLFRDPEAGDVIVFNHRSFDPYSGQFTEVDYIKRCVAIPGDYFMIDEGYVWKDDDADHSELPDSFDEADYLVTGILGHTETYPDKGGDVFKEGVWYEIPPEKYLMMGDNRGNSMDSRFWGYLDRTDIKGKAFVIYLSFEGHKEWGQMMLNLTDLPYYLTHLRWDRMLDVIK